VVFGFDSECETKEKDLGPLTSEMISVGF